MKVYLVSTGRYSDWSVRGIFSTKKKAERFISNCRNAKDFCYTDFNDIEEYALDSELAQTTFTRFYITIWLDTGSLKENSDGYHQVFGIPKSCSYVCASVYEKRGVVHAESHISAKHALKLAAEARQNWLRGRGITKVVPHD